MDTSGEAPDSFYGHIRPILITDETIPQKPNKNYFRFNSVDWIYLGKYKDMHYYITRSPMGRERFDKYTNDFEASEINVWLQKWAACTRNNNGSMTGLKESFAEWRNKTISPVDNLPLSHGISEDDILSY